MNKPTEEQLESTVRKAITATQKQNWQTWVKHLVAFLLGGAAAVASFFLNSCSSIPPEQAALLRNTHAAYHLVTGQPCIFVIKSK